MDGEELNNAKQIEPDRDWDFTIKAFPLSFLCQLTISSKQWIFGPQNSPLLILSHFKGISLEIQSMMANPIWVLPIMTVQCTLYTVKRQMWPLRRRIKGDHDLSHWWCLFTKCWFCFGALLCPDMVIPWHGMIWHAMLAMVCYCAVFSPPYVDKQEDFPPAVTKPSSNRSPPPPLHLFHCVCCKIFWFLQTFSFCFTN